MSDGNAEVFTQLVVAIVGAVTTLGLGAIKHVTDKRKADREITGLKADVELLRSRNKTLQEQLTRTEEALWKARTEAKDDLSAANERLITLLESRVQALTAELQKTHETLRRSTGKPSAPPSGTARNS